MSGIHAQCKLPSCPIIFGWTHVTMQHINCSICVVEVMYGVAMFLDFIQPARCSLLVSSVLHSAPEDCLRSAACSSSFSA